MRRIGVISSSRAWLRWILPFVISGGMAFGSLLGFTGVSPALREEGTSGDVAGAAGALMVIICLVVGFVVSAFTVVVARALQRGVPGHIGLRLGLSVLGGGIAAALGPNDGSVATTTAWALLVGTPIALSWSRRGRAGSETHTPQSNQPQR
jgi:hypothetical protein